MRRVPDLVRYVSRTAVLTLAAAYSLAVVAWLLVFHVVNGFVLFPAREGSGSDLLHFSDLGYAGVFGRVISWIGPAEQAVSLLILGAGAGLALRARGRSARVTACPWCYSPIPQAASVCRACRREVTP